MPYSSEYSSRTTQVVFSFDAVTEAVRKLGLEPGAPLTPEDLAAVALIQPRHAFACALRNPAEAAFLRVGASRVGDVELRERLTLEVRDILRREGMTALIVTHDQNEAFAMADRIGVMGFSAGGHLTAMMLAALWPSLARDRVILVNLSGRGDKDLDSVRVALRMD